MPARRLEDRIRELCARALYAKEPDWSTIMAELQSAIPQHAMRVSNTAAAVTIAGRPEIMRERREQTNGRSLGLNVQGRTKGSETPEAQGIDTSP